MKDAYGTYDLKWLSTSLGSLNSRHLSSIYRHVLVISAHTLQDCTAVRKPELDFKEDRALVSRPRGLKSIEFVETDAKINVP